MVRDGAERAHRMTAPRCPATHALAPRSAPVVVDVALHAPPQLCALGRGKAREHLRQWPWCMRVLHLHTLCTVTRSPAARVRWQAAKVARPRAAGCRLLRRLAPSSYRAARRRACAARQVALNRSHGLARRAQMVRTRSRVREKPVLVDRLTFCIAYTISEAVTVVQSMVPVCPGRKRSRTPLAVPAARNALSQLQGRLLRPSGLLRAASKLPHAAGFRPPSNPLPHANAMAGKRASAEDATVASAPQKPA